MGGTRDPENAETLRCVGAVEDCLAFERDWQYPLTTNDNPEVAARVQALWSEQDTHRDFGMYRNYDPEKYDVASPEDVPWEAYESIGHMLLPMTGFDFERDFFQKMQDAEQDLSNNPQSFAARLHNHLAQYHNYFPGGQAWLPQEIPNVVKRMLYAASTSYAHPLSNAKTVTQRVVDLPGWGHLLRDGVAKLEIELEGVDERDREGDRGAPVSGMHLNWPYRIADHKELHRVTIVRQVRRWRIVVDREVIGQLSANEQALLEAKKQLEALSDLKPMFVSGVCSLEFQTHMPWAGAAPLTSPMDAVRKTDHLTRPLNLIGFRPVPKPVLDPNGRIASPIAPRDADQNRPVPIDEYEFVRQDGLLTSPCFDGVCRAGPPLWRRARHKYWAESTLNQRRQDLYAPGGPGRKRDKAEWRNLNQDLDHHMAEWEEEIRRDRGAPALDRRRSRDDVRSSASLAGGVPNLARLKL